MPMPTFVSMHAMAVRAQNIAFGYLSLKTMKRDFRVLTNIKKFFAPNMIKIQRRCVQIIPALSAPAFHLYGINYIPPGLLKCARRNSFAWGFASAFYTAISLPWPSRLESRRTSFTKNGHGRLTTSATSRDGPTRPGVRLQVTRDDDGAVLRRLALPLPRPSHRLTRRPC